MAISLLEALTRVVEDVHVVLGLGSASLQDASAFATSAQGAKADSALQSGASTDALTEGSKLFFTTSRVLNVILTDLSTASNSAITATDTVLSALGKTQAQINSLSTAKATDFDTIDGGAI